MAPQTTRRTRALRPDTYLFFFVLFALGIFLTHIPFVELPYFWDELGQFVPAALDLYHDGAWIPHSATPNVHPPAIMAWLAGWWQVAGYSVLSTRLAMLLLASLCVLAAFLLAIELCRNVPGAPAFLAIALLGVSPLFYAQAMLAQLDMPAMLFTCLALLFFLQDRWRAAIAVSCVLVLVKETGVIVPVVFAGWLCAEKKYRLAAWFLAPAVVLGGWLAILWSHTGHLFGSQEFAQYNLFYSLHPVRLAVALARRLYYLGVGDFHWIGAVAIALAWRRTPVFATRAWKIAATLAAAHVLLVTAVGGAELERYLLPVLPILYIAMVAALATLRPGWKIAGQAALAGGLLAGNFWNPPFPFPFENNLAFTDFVKLQQAAADFLAAHYPGRRVATAWPLSAALARPELGYVERPLAVRPLPDFRRSSLESLDWSGVEVFIQFSTVWEPTWSFTRLAPVRRFWSHFYGFEPEAPPNGLHNGLTLGPVAHWERGGLWIDVYAASRGDANTVTIPTRSALEKCCCEDRGRSAPRDQVTGSQPCPLRAGRDPGESVDTPAGGPGRSGQVSDPTGSGGDRHPHLTAHRRGGVLRHVI